MEGGTGNGSYANNSKVQNYNFHALAKPRLSEAIDQCTIPLHSPCRPFRIADFGCAHGRNTLDYAEFVVQKTQQRFKLAGMPCPEIQYFFSDLPSNDFNSLFQTLQPSVIARENEETAQGRWDFYAAGVPGTFYGRLFPKESLDFVISAYSVNWLSQVPPAVVDKTSPAWNGGHVWIHGERPAVVEAYAEQFQADIKYFLKCRAQELANGAIMFLFSLSRIEEHPKGTYFPRYGIVTGLLDPTWDVMVSEGVVDAEERDMFNFPVYNFSSAEFETALEDVREMELLKIETMEKRPHLQPDMMQRLLSNPPMYGYFMVGMAKSLMKPMVEKHIGEKRAAIFFEKLQRIATEEANLTKFMGCDMQIAILRRRLD